MGNVVSDYSLVQSSIFISFSPVWISAPVDSRSIQPGLRTSEAQGKPDEDRKSESGLRRRRTVERKLREMRAEGIVRSFGPR